MSLLKKAAGLLVAATVVAGASAWANPAEGSTTKYESFNAQGTVSSDDYAPATPVKEGFTIGAPVDTFDNAGVAAAEAGDGSLNVSVQPSTDYYRYDAVKAKYVKGTYANTVVVGFEVRAKGKYAKVSDGYNVIANTVWQPPKELTPGVPNPPCQTVNDYLFKRIYNVQGSVSSKQYNLINLGIYSPLIGFVTSPLTSYNNAHVAQAAAHDNGAIGQNVILTGQQNVIAGYIAPTTRYRKQDPLTSAWSESTKDDTIQSGNAVQVTGHYGCEVMDWRFIAQYVWQPAKGAHSGSIKFSEVATQSDAGTSGVGTQDDTAYSGTDYAGDETVALGSPFTLTDVDWVLNPLTTLWEFSGNWLYTNRGGNGTLFGTMSGTWNPATNAISGSVIMDGGTGRYVGYIGSGSVSGTGINLSGSGAPTTFDGAWNIIVM